MNLFYIIASFLSIFSSSHGVLWPIEPRHPLANNSKMKMYRFLLQIALILSVSFAESFLFPWGPASPLSGKIWPPGSPWPLPQNWTDSPNLVSVDAFGFHFTIDNALECEPISYALEKYNNAFLFPSVLGIAETDQSNPVLTQVIVEVTGAENNECQNFPRFSSDSTYENYRLTISRGASNGEARITAETIWGALRGIETFSQLIWSTEDEGGRVHYYMNETIIEDRPRFPHRGLMIDSARHYLPERIFYEILDAMSYNKLNVLHWHIVDDQSFPYVSQKFPELSQKAAYNSKAIYTPEAVQRVMQNARLRGIRVVLEFDTPGHTNAFGRAFPELLTPCYGDGVTPGTPNYPNHAAYENFDPTKETTYTFMEEFFSEVFNVSKDVFVHLGMDEVYHPCWESSPEIRAFMQANNYTQISQVQEHYTQRHVAMVQNLGFTSISWQDPLDTGVPLDADVVVQVWKDWGLSWQEHFQSALNRGYRSILSAPWYINYINYGESWRKYYECDPILSLPNITEEQKRLIMGGEACIWAEFVDKTNIVPRLFPFVSAVAERLWSAGAPLNSATTDDARTRLDQHRCRMLLRGIPAQPILNGYCGGWEVEP